MNSRTPFVVLFTMALTFVAMSATPASATPERDPAIIEVEGLTLTRFVLASEVVDREPVGETTSFAVGAPVRAFLEVRNERDEPVELVVSFERAEQHAASPGVSLAVPHARRFRTYASTGVRRAPGAYVCIVRLGDTVVARQEFAVVAP